MRSFAHNQSPAWTAWTDCFHELHQVWIIELDFFLLNVLPSGNLVADQFPPAALRTGSGAAWVASAWGKRRDCASNFSPKITWQAKNVLVSYFHVATIDSERLLTILLCGRLMSTYFMIYYYLVLFVFSLEISESKNFCSRVPRRPPIWPSCNVTAHWTLGHWALIDPCGLIVTFMNYYLFFKFKKSIQQFP